MRNVAHVTEVVNKHGLPILATGATAIMLCNYNKPIVWHVGTMSIVSLLMYKFIQQQRQIDEITQNAKKDNTDVIGRLDTCDFNISNLGESVQIQQASVTQANTNIVALSPKVEALGERVAAFDKEKIDPLRIEVHALIDVIEERKQSDVKLDKRLGAIEEDVRKLRPKVEACIEKQEKMAADYKDRIVAITEEFKTNNKEIADKIEAYQAFDEQRLGQLRCDIAGAVRALDELKQCNAGCDKQLEITNKSIEDLNALLADVVTKRKEDAVDCQNRLTAMEDRIVDQNKKKFDILDDKINASLNEIKARLKGRGVIGVVKDSEKVRTNFKRPALLMASACGGSSQTP